MMMNMAVVLDVLWDHHVVVVALIDDAHFASFVFIATQVFETGV